MPNAKFPIPQGTLDMLILQILSLEPAHGYGMRSGFSRYGKDVDAIEVNVDALEQRIAPSCTADITSRGRSTKGRSVARRQLISV